MSDYNTHRLQQHQRRFNPQVGPPASGVSDHATVRDGSAIEHVNMSPEPVLSSVKRDRFTMTVDDAIAEFSRNGFLVAPRTIQRWCQASKIDAIKVDANTLLPTNREPWKLLIDASSVASRIATERDNPNTALKTISPKTPKPLKDKLEPIELLLK